MNFLESIPGEILDQILENCGNHSLLDLSYASRFLRRCSEGFLYHTINIPCTQLWFTETAIPSLLLRTILTRPELAHYIVNVHLFTRSPADQYGSYNKAQLDTYYNSREKKALHALISDMKLPKQEHWIQSLHFGYGEIKKSMVGWIALVLSQLNRLRNLTIMIHQPAAVLLKKIWEMMGHCLLECPHAFPGNSGFKSVRCFKCKVLPFPEWGTITFKEQFMSIFHMPALEELELVLPKNTKLSFTLPFMPALTSLSLAICCMKSQDHILTGCPHLKRLDCRIWTDYYHPVDLNELPRILQPVKQTLENLRISVRPKFGIRSYGSFGTFKDFKKLTTLETTLSYLLDFKARPISGLAEILPPNLRELRVRHDTHYVDGFVPTRIYFPSKTTDILWELVEQKETIAPNLHSLICINLRLDKQKLKDPLTRDLEEFKELCERKGIQWDTSWSLDE